MTGLGDLPGGAFESEAYRISGDGSTIVGLGRNENGQRAFRWTEEGGMIDLGDLEGGYGSVGYAVSADGSVVVGSASNAAFIWTEALGMRSLEEILVDSYGLDLQGFRLAGATAISTDGRTIAGSGYTPSGTGVAWLAVLPEGRLGTLLGMVLLPLVWIRFGLRG